MSLSNCHWSQGLLQTMKDPNALVISNDTIVVIKDKFPKAKYHFLVLPCENIPSIFSLTKNHLNLLHEMNLMALNAIEVSGRPQSEFKIGYHIEPSMQRLHLHVISCDFQSSCLKTKKHWNSFNTAYFVKHQDIIDQLNKNGKITKLTANVVKELLSTPLMCPICNAKFKTMPSLKDHLRTHNEALYDFASTQKIHDE